MLVTMDQVKKLRDLSGAGMMDCKSALEEADGDLDKAYTILREKGIAKAAKRAGRSTGQGVVDSYLHRTGDDFPPQVGVLVEVASTSLLAGAALTVTFAVDEKLLAASDAVSVCGPALIRVAEYVPRPLVRVELGGSTTPDDVSLLLKCTVPA